MVIDDTEDDTKILIPKKKLKEIIAWKAKVNGKWVWHHSYPEGIVKILREQKISVHTDTIFYESLLYRKHYSHGPYRDRQLGYLEMEVNRFKIDEGDLKTKEIPNSNSQ